MTPIERAARALCEGQQMLFLRDPRFPESPPTQTVKVLPSEWDEIGEAAREEFRRQVRLVLTAIREPSEEMKVAGMNACGGDGSVLDGYEAMIDALLAETAQ